jgi:nicotinate-nucleotide adenylyltransferase
MQRRIAVYGGSFDPFHLGHLIPAIRAQETFHFDAVDFVPAAKPPHKLDAPMTPITHRFAMVALATLPYDRFFVSDLEMIEASVSYTVDTVRRYREQCPDDHLYFILGSDSFSQIATWHRWQELVDLAHLVVLHRPHMWGETLLEHVPAAARDRLRRVRSFAAVADPDAPTIFLLDHEPFPISATSIRDRQRRGLPIRELVPHEVHAYIVKYGLYRSDAEPCEPPDAEE